MTKDELVFVLMRTAEIASNMPDEYPIGYARWLAEQEVAEQEAMEAEDE